MKKMMFVFMALLPSSLLAEPRYVALWPDGIRTVFGAMKEMGCSTPWLSVILDTSDIPESDVNILPPGTKVYAPSTCDDSILTPKIRRRTNLIFKIWNDRERLKAVEKELAVIRAENVRLTREMSNLTRSLAEVNQSWDAKIAELVNLEKDVSRRQKVSRRWGIVIGVVSIILLSVLVWIVASKKFGYKIARTRLLPLRVTP